MDGATTTTNEGKPARLVSARSWRAHEPVIERKDFRQPPKPSGQRRDELEGLGAELGAIIQGAMARYLRAQVRVSLDGFDIRPYQDTVSETTEATWMVPLVAQGGDRGVLMLDEAIQVHLIARLLGEQTNADATYGGYGADGPDGPDDMGATSSADVVTAETSDAAADEAGRMDDSEPAPASAEPAVAAPRVGPMSRAVLTPFLRSLLLELNDVLRRDGMDPFTIDEDRYGLPAARLMRAADVLAVFRYEVREGRGGGQMGLLLRTSALAPLLSSDDGNRLVGVEPRARKRLEQVVRRLDMKLGVRLGSATIDLGSFLALQAGDVLILDRRLGESLEMAVNGQPMYAVQPGRSAGRIAARIVERIVQREST